MPESYGVKMVSMFDLCDGAFVAVFLCLVLYSEYTAGVEKNQAVRPTVPGNCNKIEIGGLCK